MIKAVVFDSDGTLLDGFEVIAGAYAHVASLHGYPAPTKEAVRTQLSQAPPLYEILRTFFPEPDMDAMLQANGEYVVDHATDIRMFDGLKELLQTLHKQGIKLAIVTGGNHKIHDLLQHHEIEQYFTSVVHCDRVNLSKPDPEGFNLALAECGVLPSEAIMVGDSPTDILAGKNGHAAYTVGITHGNGSRSSLAAANADYLIDSLPELIPLIKKL